MTGVMSEAERRYHMEAEFHARVELTVQLLEFDRHASTGDRLSDDEARIAGMAAAVALVLAERHPATGEPL